MADLKQTIQQGGGVKTGMQPKGEEPPVNPDNEGAEFGTSERATRGTNRDADRSGESKNQGHGHPEKGS